VFSIEDAGSLAGLSRSASYRAVRRGDIPTITFGRRRVVPAALWLDKLDGAV
jgi:hypothetical protein